MKIDVVFIGPFYSELFQKLDAMSRNSNLPLEYWTPFMTIVVLIRCVCLESFGVFDLLNDHLFGRMSRFLTIEKVNFLRSRIHYISAYHISEYFDA